VSDISSLGYVRIRVTDMDAWRRFAFDTIGFAEGHGPEAGALYLRMDERIGRLVLLPGEVDRVDAVGWEVRDHLALRRVQSAVEAAGIATKPLSQEDADARRVEAGLSFEAPGATPVEVFYGPALDHSPVATPYGNRFVTGKLGAGPASVINISSICRAQRRKPVRRLHRVETRPDRSDQVGGPRIRAVGYSGEFHPPGWGRHAVHRRRCRASADDRAQHPQTLGSARGNRCSNSLSGQRRIELQHRVPVRRRRRPEHRHVVAVTVRTAKRLPRRSDTCGGGT